MARPARRDELPESRHLEILREAEGYLLRFRPRHEITLGSEIRARQAMHVARTRLRAARPLALEEEPGGAGLVARFAPEKLPSLRRAVARLELLLGELAAAPLTPLMVQEILHCTPAERQRWTRAGRLRTAGTATFWRHGRSIEYSLYDTPTVAALDEERVEMWREADREASARRRASGAAQAAMMRRVTAMLRSEAPARLRQLAAEIAPETPGIAHLAALATLCDRMAESYATRRNREREAEFAGLRDGALRILATHPGSRLARAAAVASRGAAEVELCPRHHAAWHEEQVWSGITEPRWAMDHAAELARCPDCRTRAPVPVLMELDLGIALFAWILPWRAWMPDPAALPPARVQPEEAGMLLRGERFDAAEIRHWTAARLAAEARAALARMGAARQPPSSPGAAAGRRRRSR